MLVPFPLPVSVEMGSTARLPSASVYYCERKQRERGGSLRERRVRLVFAHLDDRSIVCYMYGE